MKILFNNEIIIRIFFFKTQKARCCEGLRCSERFPGFSVCVKVSNKVIYSFHPDFNEIKAAEAKELSTSANQRKADIRIVLGGGD